MSTVNAVSAASDPDMASARQPLRPRVDVGVVTWNTAELTATALRRLLDTDQGCDVRILVHDNASTDGTPELLDAAVPEAKVEVAPGNVGFAAGVNRLVERSDAPWFFALNSDAWPEPGAIGALVSAAERHERAAAVAPRLLRPDGSVEHSTHPFPSVGLALLDAVGGRSWLPTRRLEDLALEGAWHHDRPRRVDWAVGAALLIRRQALLDVGGFDERGFMYVEDVEWCWRARRRGWEVRFEPAAVVRHVGNASGAIGLGDRRHQLDAANLHRFLDETQGPVRAGAYRALSAVAIGERVVAARLAGRAGEAHYWRSQLRARVQGARDGRVNGRKTRREGTWSTRRGATRSWRGDPTWPATRNAGGTSAATASGPTVEIVHDAPSGTTPRVSVAVSTRGRAALLPRLVAALEAQTLPADELELVVVDDASPDDTAEVLGALARRSKVPMRVLTCGQRGGPAAGRNLAWRAARAPVVAFTDDDCTPDPDWLASGLAALDLASGAARMVTGRTAMPDDQIALATRPFARHLQVDGVRFFETCNAFYRRTDLEAVGGFDERFGFGGEDTDLGLRMVQAGVTPVFARGALVHHDVHTGTLADALHNAARFVDLPLVVRRHPEIRSSLVHHKLFWKRAHPSAIAAVLGLLTFAKWPVTLVAVVPWLNHRLRVEPACPGRFRRVAALPGVFLVDICEVATMVRGSARHKTVLL